MIAGEIDDEEALRILEGMDWDDRLEPEAGAPETEAQTTDGGFEDREAGIEHDVPDEELSFEAVLAEINRVKSLSPAALEKEQLARDELERRLERKQGKTRREEEIETFPPTTENSSSVNHVASVTQSARGLNAVLQAGAMERWNAEFASREQDPNPLLLEETLDEIISAERARVDAEVREIERKTLFQAQTQTQTPTQTQTQKDTRSKVIYRIAVPDDAAELSIFAKKTFTDTFFVPCGYTEKDLQAYLDKSYEPHHWVEHMNQPDKCLMVAYAEPVAVIDASVGAVAPPPPPARMIGYSLVAGPMDLPVPCDKLSADDKARSGEVVKLYVCPSTFGTGVAQQLMDCGLVWLLARFPGDVYLSVWSQNYRAQGFYNKYGGQFVAKYKYQVGDTEDDEWVYILPRTRIQAYFAATTTSPATAPDTATATATATAAAPIPGGSAFGFRNFPAQPRKKASAAAAAAAEEMSLPHTA